MAVKILIDSSSDIDEKEATKLGIVMLPMQITFGVEEYFDGVDLLPDQFYEKLTTSKDLPKTAQITPYRFEEAFNDMTKDGDEVVAIILSSKLSGTFEAARQAAKGFEGKVFVLDSLSATVGERLLCQYALQLIEKGLSAKEVFEALENAKERICVMGVLETLEYLKKGGRISGAVAVLGTMLNLKPVVKLTDGEVKMAGKARGKKKGLEFLNGLIGENWIDFSMPYGILYTGLDKAPAEEYILEHPEIWQDGADTPLYVMGSTIGTHVGPGVIGVAYFAK